MATTTTRLGLYKPDPADFINVNTDLNSNADSIDSKIGALPCTSGTRPATPYNGQFIRETDTGKMYVCTNTVGPVWTQLLFNNADFGQTINLPGFSQQVKIGTPASTASFASKRSAGADLVLSGHIAGDTEHRVNMDASGKFLWGPGGVTAPDSDFYRLSAGVLRTNGSYQVGGSLSVGGDANLGGDANVTGNLNIGSARHRPQLGVVYSITNLNTEQLLASMTVPAGDAVAGAIYRIKVCGLASVTGTPTLTLRMRVGGLAGTGYSNFGAITFSSGGQNRIWIAEYDIHILTTGASGTARYFARLNHSFTSTNNVPHSTVVPILDASAASAPAFDTTIARDIVVTGQWSAASASNTTTCYFADMQRVA